MTSALDKLDTDRTYMLNKLAACTTFDLKKVMVDALLATVGKNTKVDYHKACVFKVDDKKYTFTVKLEEIEDI